MLTFLKEYVVLLQYQEDLRNVEIILSWQSENQTVRTVYRQSMGMVSAQTVLLIGVMFSS